MSAAPPPESSPTIGGGTSAFRHRGYLLYWISRFLATFGAQIVSVAVGWQVYDLTRDPFDLGIVGLVQFLPALLLVLVTGVAADRFNRRLIMAMYEAAEALCCAILLFLVWKQHASVVPIFAVLVLFGVARAFLGPAQSSLVPNLVPSEDLSNAIAWNSSAWQIATIVGPVAGGLLYGISAEAAYGVACVLMCAAVCLVLLVPKPPQKRSSQATSLETLFAGFRYVWKEKVVLGAISLDLFAVLLGGATALLPVYARDILETGPWGLGLLRAAPGIGAVIVALWLARYPIRNHAGMIMFGSVAGFGLATIIFGFSTIVWLSVIALFLMGAFDMVSVYVRETLLQLWTPDAVRGRVNAVNMVFVGTSNELGEFRAGLSAAWIGTVPAVSTVA